MILTLSPECDDEDFEDEHDNGEDDYEVDEDDDVYILILVMKNVSYFSVEIVKKFTYISIVDRFVIIF